MKCYEFNDNCGVRFWVFAPNMKTACDYAQAVCGEDPDSYSVHALTTAQAETIAVLGDDDVETTAAEMLIQHIKEHPGRCALVAHTEA